MAKNAMLSVEMDVVDVAIESKPIETVGNRAQSALDALRDGNADCYWCSRPIWSDASHDYGKEPFICADLRDCFDYRTQKGKYKKLVA